MELEISRAGLEAIFNTAGQASRSRVGLRDELSTRRRRIVATNLEHSRSLGSSSTDDKIVSNDPLHHPSRCKIDGNRQNHRSMHVLRVPRSEIGPWGSVEYVVFHIYRDRYQRPFKSSAFVPIRARSVMPIKSEASCPNPLFICVSLFHPS
jgi:hypothetical protein